jgi:hypothetical protein
MISSNGGAWENSEIIPLPDPSRSEVESAMGEIVVAQYAFVHFSGHGWVDKDSRSGRKTQMIILGDGSSIDLMELLPKTVKSTLSCDACRKVHVRPSKDTLRGLLEKLAFEEDNRQLCRIRFDEAISNANPGTYYMFGCAMDTYCYEDPINGGYFTSALIDNASDWSRLSHPTPCLSIPSVVTMAKETVRSQTSHLDPVQIPIGNPGNRNGNEFPFAVSVKPRML